MRVKMPRPMLIAVPLIGRDWYSLKNQAKGARMEPAEYIQWVLFRRKPGDTSYRPET